MADHNNGLDRSELVNTYGHGAPDVEPSGDGSLADAAPVVTSDNKCGCWANFTAFPKRHPLAWQRIKTSSLFSISFIMGFTTGAQAFLGRLEISLGEYNSFHALWHAVKAKSERMQVAGATTLVSSTAVNTVLNMVYLPDAAAKAWGVAKNVGMALSLGLPVAFRSALKACSVDTPLLDRYNAWYNGDEESFVGRHWHDDLKWYDYLSTVWAFGSALTIAQMTRETFSIAGNAGSLFPFMFSLMAYFATRVNGLIGLFELLANLKNRQNRPSEFQRLVGNARVRKALYASGIALGVFVLCAAPLFAKELLGGIDSLTGNDWGKEDNYQVGWKLAMGYVFSAIPSVAFYVKSAVELMTKESSHYLIATAQRSKQYVPTKTPAGFASNLISLTTAAAAFALWVARDAIFAEDQWYIPLAICSTLVIANVVAVNKMRENMKPVAAGLIIGLVLMGYVNYQSAFSMGGAMESDIAAGAFHYLHAFEGNVWAKILGTSAFTGAMVVNLKASLQFVNRYLTLGDQSVDVGGEHQPLLGDDHGGAARTLSDKGSAERGGSEMGPVNGDGDKAGSTGSHRFSSCFPCCKPKADGEEEDALSMKASKATTNQIRRHDSRLLMQGALQRRRTACSTAQPHLMAPTPVRAA